MTHQEDEGTIPNCDFCGLPLGMRHRNGQVVIWNVTFLADGRGWHNGCHRLAIANFTWAVAEWSAS